MTQEGDGAIRTKSFRGGWNAAAKPCDFCRSAAALLFCHADSAFMCMACDAKVHSAEDKLHARVWMCEVCEQAPAAVTCKADAAALCVTCDRDIHAANPLSRRHQRTAVVPFYDTAESLVIKTASTIPISNCTTTTTSMFDVPRNYQERKLDTGMANDGYVSDQWIFPNPVITPKLPAEKPEFKSMEYLFSEPDQLLEFDSYLISSQPCGDSVVPVQTTVKPSIHPQLTHDHSSEKNFDFDFAKSNFSSFLSGYTTSSLSHSVSTSSMDVGVVPDGGAMSDISYPFPRNMSSSVDLAGNKSSSVVGMNREAKVLRYKEKRKNRKFEKTIRYASRKAYAEIRPRIKGRFAKRTDSESELAGISCLVSADFGADAIYGIVPSL